MDEENKAGCWKLGLICTFYFGFIFLGAGIGLLAGGISSKDSEYTDGEALIIIGSIFLPIGLIVMIAGGFCCRHVMKKRREAFRNMSTVQGPVVTGTVPMGQVGSGQPYSQLQGYDSFSAPQPAASAPPPPSYADVTKR